MAKIYGGKNVTAIKAEMRKDTFNFLLEKAKEEYGEDCVSVVGTNEIAVAIGVIKDKDGFEQEVCVTIKPTVKEWEDRTTAKKIFVQYDRLDEAEMYEMSVKEKEEEKAKKEEEKAKKKEADKKAREKAKKEKEQQKKEEQEQAEEETEITEETAEE